MMLTHCARLNSPLSGSYPISKPLFLDEPTAGMTLLLADQNLKFCRRVSDRGYIIEKGCIVHADSMVNIWNDEDVISKYLVL